MLYYAHTDKEVNFELNFEVDFFVYITALKRKYDNGVIYRKKL